MEQLNIRKAEKEDVKILHSLIKELAEYEKLSGEFKVTEELLYENMFVKGFASALIAEYDGTVAGMAIFFNNFSTFTGKPGLYLEDLYVKPEYRGKGIGKALLLNLVKVAFLSGCGRMEWAVLDWNTSAADFYKTFSAKHVEGWNIFRIKESSFEEILLKSGFKNIK